MSVGHFAASTLFDGLGVYVRPLRIRGLQGGARRLFGTGMHRAKREVYKSLHYAFRHTPRRKLAFSLGWNAASLYKSSRRW